MQSLAQIFIAGPAHGNGLEFTGAFGDWSAAAVALKALGGFEAGAVVAKFTEQAWREFLAWAWQGAEDVVIGMLIEQGFNPLAKELELGLDGAQHLDARGGEHALGGGDARAAAELNGAREDFETFFLDVGAVKTVGVEELFPFPPARRVVDGRRTIA